MTGVKTSSILDKPIEIASYVARHLNANGVDFTSATTVKLLNYDITAGTLANYDEAAISQTVTLATLGGQDMVLAYNKFRFLRIQETLEQDIPVASLASKFARSWVYEKFIPDFDAYALGKIVAARPVANALIWNPATDNIKLRFFNVVSRVKRNGGAPGSMLAFVPFAFADSLKALITTFDGSNLGYEAGKNGVLGQLDGVMVVETDDAYFPSVLIDVVVLDKRAVVKAVPKMDPATGSGMRLLKEVGGHGGSELQLRARGDVFVFGLKARAIATLARV